MIDTLLTAAAYALLGAWSTGCCLAPLAISKETDWRYEPVSAALVLMLGLPLGVMLALIPWAMWAHAASPDLATLKRSEWACSASHRETTYVQSGKVLAPLSSDVCDAYQRKP